MVEINDDWFKIKRLKTNIYAIQENISVVHPVYTNDPLNIYLLLGSHTALLIDTGCGLSPLKPLVNKLIGKRKLLVFNSHAHWDHILGNQEFDEVHIHENEAFIISNPYDLSHSKEIFGKCYAKKNLTIPACKVIKILRDGDSFDLGEIKVKVIHTPGHSIGSICLLTNTGELFTGDVAYYGDQFLPRPIFFPIVIDSLSKLIKICEAHKTIELYPSHRKTPCDMTLLYDLLNGIKNIENLWDTRQKNEIFNAYYVEDQKFRYYIM